MNSLVKNLKASATLALNQKAKDFIAQGKPVINLTTGEPDFKTSDRIQKAAIDAIKSGKHFYTASAGIIELREAIAKTSQSFYQKSYKNENVIVTNGGKQALFNAMFSILEPEDEVLILKPYWVSYPEIVKLCKGKPVLVESHFEKNFLPDIEDLKKEITSKTKALIINSPSNPTSQVFPKAWIEECLSVLNKNAPQAYVLTDDIYGKLILDQQTYFSAAMSGKFDQDKIIVINGLSKTYSMTGWRVGWALAHEDIISAMTKIQSQTTANVSAISQWAALEAVSGNQNDVQVMQETFIQRRNECLKIIKDIPRCKVLEPHGGFYFFFDVREAMKKMGFESDIELSNMLLEKYFLALVPGSAFGKNGFLRMSFAANMNHLTEGLNRLKQAFALKE
ncbi:MAG TPA: pyridoxal phosphate-dependent aminotransferase [Oligoflexia bacterium]|nr:pyridoxal phosphate-dependent aminotransferase [Oligoflexia bacterium]HMR23758.1 pyridoxal phosphate-dependent aminotransferase [Oligoflexia bacterium]